MLPARPRKIAVITAETGAVLQDIRRVSARRDPSVPLMLLPVRVQGAGAAEEIAAAVVYFACDESAYTTGQILSVSGGFGLATPLYGELAGKAMRR